MCLCCEGISPHRLPAGETSPAVGSPHGRCRMEGWLWRDMKRAFASGCFSVAMLMHSTPVIKYRGALRWVRSCTAPLCLMTGVLRMSIPTAKHPDAEWCACLLGTSKHGCPWL